MADKEALLKLADPSDAAAKRLGESLRTKDEWTVLPLRELLPGLSLVDDPHFSVRLSVRAANAILRARIGSLKDLAAMTPEAIFELPQIGEKVADEILAVVIGLWATAYADSGKDRPPLSTRMAAAQPIQAPVRLDDLTDALVRIEESAGFEAFRRRQLNSGVQPTQAKVALELEIPPERVAHYEKVIREKLARQVRNEQSPVPIAIAQLRNELGVLARPADLEQALAAIDPARIAIPDDMPHRVELILQLAGYRIAAECEGGDWRLAYDGRGNRQSMIDPREHETTYEYDLQNRMTKASEPLGVTTEYGYDASGDLTSITDPRGYITSYLYDKLGRVSEIHQPLEKTTGISYDGAGNPLSRTTAAGTLEYGYDAANRLQEVAAGESTLRSFGYDAANRLTSAVDAQSHKVEIGYSEDGQASSINDGRGQSLTRTYNSRGELTKQVDARGTIEYAYDKLRRLTSLTDPQGKALGFVYDPEGNLTKVERPNGVTTTNVYDNAGRLAETISEEEPSTVLESLKYGYDTAGNVATRIDERLEQETTYAYDALNRLTEFNTPGEGVASFGYDAAGNRIEAGGTTYSYNALNQLSSASDGTTYNYDGAGRLTSMANGSEETSYEWDLLDHLASVEGPMETTTYAYDGLGRLSERANESGTQVTHYGDLTDLRTYDANGKGETTISYVQGAHGLVEQRSGETITFPLPDAHGDITTITGPAGGVESRQTYDPWGVRLSGPTLEMGYLGAQERPADPASGLIQMGERSYSPSLGGFISEDPVFGHFGVGTSVDRYLYVWDNPSNRFDLDGRDICILEACVGEGLEDVAATVNGDTEIAGEIIDTVGSGTGSGAEAAWNWTGPGRGWVANRAQDFWKEYGSTLEGIYEFAGANWQLCIEGVRAGAPAGAAVGALAGPEGAPPGAWAGGVAGCAGTSAAGAALSQE